MKDENFKRLLEIHDTTITRAELKQKLMDTFPNSRYSTFVRIGDTSEHYVVKPCEQCGNDYNMNLKNRGKYCSRACVGKSTMLKQEVECLNCSTTFIKKNAQIKKHPNNFCSSACAATYHNKERAANGYSTKSKTTPVLCIECSLIFDRSIHSTSEICEPCKNQKDGALDKKERIAIKARKISEKHRTSKKETDANGNTNWVPKSNSLCQVCTKDTGKIGAKYCDECRPLQASLTRIEAIKNGKSNGVSIKCTYIFDGKDVKCDSKLEYSCLNYFETNFKIKNISRADMSIPYIHNGKQRLYLPDFEIIMSDGTKYIVECKSSVGKKLNEKWHMYNETAPLKKEALEEWCKENNYIPFWFEAKLHRKYYNNLKL